MVKINTKYIDYRLDQKIYEYKNYTKTIQYDYLGNINKMIYKRIPKINKEFNIYKCINYNNKKIQTKSYKKNVMVYNDKEELIQKIFFNDYKTAVIVCNIIMFNLNHYKYKNIILHNKKHPAILLYENNKIVHRYYFINNKEIIKLNRIHKINQNNNFILNLFNYNTIYFYFV